MQMDRELDAVESTAASLLLHPEVMIDQKVLKVNLKRAN